MSFDEAGNRLNVEHPISKVEAGIDGCHVETTYLQGLDTWSMHFLNDVCLFTGGATWARTEFLPSGGPLETLLLNDHNLPVARVRYVLDESKRVLELRQDAADNSSTDRGGDSLLDSQAALIRIAFSYNADGMVTDISTDLAGQASQAIRYSYNERGDRVLTKALGEEPFRHEYEYDFWGNWVMQHVFHSASESHYRRELEYYVENGVGIQQAH